MKASIRYFVFLDVFVFFLPILSYAASGTLNAYVATTSTGKGLVYVDKETPAASSTVEGKNTDGDWYAHFKLGAIPNEGYDFSAWREEDSPNATVYSTSALLEDYSFYAGSGPTTKNMYAFFSAHDYKIKFQNGYNDLENKEKIYTIESTSIELPELGHRENYGFDGWKVISIGPSYAKWQLGTTYTESTIPLDKYYGDVVLQAQWHETTPGNLSISVDGLNNNDSILCSIIRLSDGNKINDIVIRNNEPAELVVDPDNYKIIPDHQWSLNYLFEQDEYTVNVPVGGPGVVNIEMSAREQKRGIEESHKSFSN